MADGPPREKSRDALNTSTPKLADKPTLADGPTSESRIDALNTATPNLAHEPTLANGFPPSELRIDALNTDTSTPKLADMTYFGRNIATDMLVDVTLLTPPDWTYWQDGTLHIDNTDILYRRAHICHIATDI